MKNTAVKFTNNLNSNRNFISDLLADHQPPIDSDSAIILATQIMKDIAQFRRTVASEELCHASCEKCIAPHLQKVVSLILQNKPITFVLPAFPGKSPNRSKVLGALPDMAERCSLDFLQYLCKRIQQLYRPGAHIILCSDGRVFSDVVGMRETDVTAYQEDLSRMIREYELANISTFNLDELCNGNNFVQVREKLMDQYASPLESLREKVRRGGYAAANAEEIESLRLYCGITRFLVEDATHAGQTRSRTAVQKDCKTRAYEVIRRSNAWSLLISERFPDAVRLSIHPQICGSTKLGIQLLGAETWMTPWHGVAVEIGGRFSLMKRWEAERLATQLVLDSNGRASHYKLIK